MIRKTIGKIFIYPFVLFMICAWWIVIPSAWLIYQVIEDDKEERRWKNHWDRYWDLVNDIWYYK